ncbi:MAG: TIGR01244 family phosphatase, partial [Gammaproteobacteria bacterium]|nr:TIGR01244 family phosphatase [Gammaproteobacteria bacterium]
FQEIVAASSGPVLAYCRSGQRSSVLWQYSGAP